MIIHILFVLAVLALGFGLGRIKHASNVPAKLTQDVKTVEADAKKVVTEVKSKL